MARIQTTLPGGPKGSASGKRGSQVTAKKRELTVKEKVADKLQARSSATGKTRSLASWFKPTEEGFVNLYEASVLAQVGWLRSGLGARDAKSILGQLHFPRGEALSALQIAIATVNRKAKNNAALSTAEGERVLGVGRLLGQVQTIVRASGNADGFDASSWLSTWMSSPVPALGGARPLDLMDTMTGQALVSQLLAQMQSGAYA